MGQYDDSVKALCLHSPASIFGWIRGSARGPLRVVRHSESVPTATRQVDALLTVDDEIALHIEFQAESEPDFALRMLDYRLRLLRLPELAGIALSQHVVMLGRGNIDDRWWDSQLDYRYHVHHLRNEPVAPLLTDVGLAPFAALADLPDDHHRAQTLRAALDFIAQVDDPHTREVLAQATVDLAALRLDAATIDSNWEESAMPIPSLLRQRYDEGLEQGLEQGLEAGREAGREEFVGSMLRQRFGSDERIPAIAHRLAAMDPDECLGHLAAAANLEELAQPGDRPNSVQVLPGSARSTER